MLDHVKIIGTAVAVYWRQTRGVVAVANHLQCLSDAQAELATVVNMQVHVLLDEVRRPEVSLCVDEYIYTLTRGTTRWRQWVHNDRRAMPPLDVRDQSLGMLQMVMLLPVDAH